MTDTIKQTGIEIIQAPGTMQLRVPQLTDDETLAQQFEQLALRTAGVTSIHVDRSASTVVITHKSDAATIDRLRSRLATLIGNHCQTVPPSPPQISATSHCGTARPSWGDSQKESWHTGNPGGGEPQFSRGESSPAQQPPQPSNSPSLVDSEPPPAQHWVAGLQQQLADLQQQLAAQSDYKFLLAQCQQQKRVIADLQQQLSKLQAAQKSVEPDAQLRRLAAIGEHQLNKWQYRPR